MKLFLRFTYLLFMGINICGAVQYQARISFDTGDNELLRQVFYKNNKLYVLIEQDAKGIVYMYNKNGDFIKSHILTYNNQNVCVVDSIQVLWEEECFLIPGFVSVGNSIAGVVQKFNYNLEKDLDFAHEGTLIFPTDVSFAGFSSIAYANNLYFAGGELRRISEPDNAPESCHCILVFNNNGDIVNFYKEAEFFENYGRSLNRLKVYYKNNMYYALGLSFFGGLYHMPLIENTISFVLDDDSKIIDNISALTFSGDNNHEIYAIDGVANKIYSISIDPGEIPFAQINGDPVDIPVLTDFQYITSAHMRSGYLYVGGGYNLPEAEEVASAPFIMRFKEEADHSLTFDSSFLETGIVTFDYIINGFIDFYYFYISEQANSLALIGYKNVFFTVKNFFKSNENPYIALYDLKRQYFIPFVS